MLRSYLRQRSMLVAMASRAVQHMQKALEQMHLKLTEVVSAITGKTGMTILRALLAGERDPQVLASLALGALKHKRPQLELALTGQFTGTRSQGRICGFATLAEKPSPFYFFTTSVALNALGPDSICPFLTARIFSSRILRACQD